jgi:hypothetical protein
MDTSHAALVPAGARSTCRTLPEIVAGYETIPGLEHLYLEDSWVLGVFESTAGLSFDLEVVLTEQHPQWHPARPDEVHAYRRVSLTFPSVRTIEWLQRGSAPATDATGEQDWGHIDWFVVDNDVYELEGDWGHVRVVSEPPQIHDR